MIYIITEHFKYVDSTDICTAPVLCDANIVHELLMVSMQAFNILC